MTNYTVKDALKELMAAWEKVEAAAKKEYPMATKEELYEICWNVMFLGLKLKGGCNYVS